MKIKEIRTPSPQCISPDANLVEAAVMMKKWDVGILPVCKNERIIGVITDRDITIRAVARGSDPNATMVFQVMSGEFIHCLDDDEIEKALEIMEMGRVRRLPVLNQDRALVGIISLGDLAARLDKVEIAGRLLKHISTRPQNNNGTAKNSHGPLAQSRPERCQP
jgi:CBS domain-containing protein